MFPFLGPLLHHVFGLGIINSKATRHLLDVLDQALKDRRQDSKVSNNDNDNLVVVIVVVVAFPS